MKIGLVLEGGAMRGMYTSGILDVWMDQGIRVDALFGVSAGALFGLNLFSGQRGRALRYNKKYIADKRYMSVHSLVTTGDLFNREFAYYRLPSELDPFDDAAFKAYGGEFVAVVTNVETGEPEYLRIRSAVDQIEELRASASMPFVSKFVELNGKKYLDGGITDSIPVRACLERGYDRVVVVLTRPADYRKKPMKRALIRAYYHRYPLLADALIHRHERYNAQCEEVMRLEEEGRIFVIRPETALPIARIERRPEKLQEVYDRGVADAQKRLPELLAYLKP